jgi:hypothetical protein
MLKEEQTSSLKSQLPRRLFLHGLLSSWARILPSPISQLCPKRLVILRARALKVSGVAPQKCHWLLNYLGLGFFSEE